MRFVVGGELSQIIEDLRLGVDPAVRLNPLEALIQESGGGFLVATREGLGQIVVRLRNAGVSSAAASGLLESKINTAPNKIPVASARVKKRLIVIVSSTTK